MLKIISSQECESIVKQSVNNDDIKIVSYKILPHVNCHGFLSEHLSIQVKLQRNGEDEITKHRYFARRFPTNILKASFAKDVNSFGREISMFEVALRKFCATIPKYENDFAPKFYLGRKDDLIVLEDLSIKGYTIAKKPNLNLLDLDHIRVVLKTLAKFHSGSLAYEEIKSKELNRNFSLLEDFNFELNEPLFSKTEGHLGKKYLLASMDGLMGTIQEVPKNCVSTRELKDKMWKLFYDAFEVMQPQKKFRNVLCHGDLWPRNFLYKYENDLPTFCKLVDFQLLRYFPPAHDVLLLIFLTTNKEMRQHHFHNLLRYYHNCLKEEMAKYGYDIKRILSFDEFKVSVHHLLPTIKLFTAIELSMLAANTEYMTDILRNPEDFENFVFGNRSPYIKMLLELDEDYKYLLTEAVIELKEILTIPKVTREDCYKVMNRKLGSSYYTFDSFQVIPFSEASGFCGDYYKLIIFIHHNVKKREYDFFVKCMPSGKSPNRMALETGLFSKEIFIYETFSQLANNIDVDFINDCITTCYFTRVNDLEIMDDLSLKGYKTLSALQPFNLELLTMAIRKLAQFHASSLVVEEKMTDQLEIKYRLNEEHADNLKEKFFLKYDNHHGGRHWRAGVFSIDLVLDLCSGVLDLNTKELPFEDFRTKARHMQDLFFEIIKPSDRFRNVICHGDMWITNILFKFVNNKPVDCKFIDFQMIRYCPPGQDIFTIIHVNTDRETRTKHSKELTEIYYQELAKSIEDCGYSIEDIYPYDEYVKMLDYMKPFSLVHNIIMREMISCTPDEIKGLLKDEETCNKIFFEDRSELIKNMFSKSVYYRTVLSEAVLDMYEYCKIKSFT
ncbi:uncharacterized protein LOC109600574 [Aethina tumida]|uniref:uncharacterized protein LOC109600574 n=1 Tax=Aethina tumida TaxID=116153 RepID=UPI002147E4F6|nr:uncharacterized protein LOC109600574 [Aethina tumida]